MSERKVLVVDDCRMTTLLIRHILANEGIPSDAAGTGPEGEEKACNGDYAVAVVDIVLPGFDGVELAERLYEKLGDDRPEVFLMTGMGEHFQDDMVDRARARGVFFKPITPSKVSKAIALTLASVETPAEA